MIKWIGQNIWNFVSRFRNDVYLESVIKTGSDPDKFLAIDSDNKVVYRTGVEIISDIGAGDITEVSITTDSGSSSKVTEASGSADFTILGTSSVPAEIDHDSLNNFVAAEHYRWDNNISATATIDANNIPTLNQSTTGNAATATNLTASTSTAVQLGTIELGHADDTTIARSASGIATIEGNEIMTRNKMIHVIQTAFSDNMATSEHFIPFNSVFESAAITNVNVPVLMPAAGKLLKIHMKVSVNHNVSSNEVTFKLYDVDNDELWSSGNSNGI